MKIHACPRCGSQKIYIGTMDSGVTFGITSNNYTCKNCNYNGMPLIFNNKKNYMQFLKGFQKENETKKTNKEEKTKETKEEGEKNEEAIIPEKEITHWHGKRSWWIEIILAFLISAALFLYGLPTMINTLDLIFILYYLIVFFIEALVLLIAIVFFEYIGYLIYKIFINN